MKYFLAAGGVRAYEDDGSQDHLIPPGAVHIAEEQVPQFVQSARGRSRAPRVVTMRQARLALYAAGLLPKVDAAIQGLAEPHKTAAQIEWEYSQEVDRDKALVQLLAPTLGLTDADLDALFAAAAVI